MAFGGIAGSRKLRCAVSFAALMVIVAGCTHPDMDHEQSREQTTRLVDRAPPAPRVDDSAPPPIPSLQPIIAAPPAPSASQRLVSLSVTDPNIPVRDILLELARKVGVDIDLDPAVTGGVIITARDRPFVEVVSRICDQDNLRFTLKDNVLKVEPDTLYYQAYHLDMVNSVRSLTTDIASSLSLSSLIQGGGASGGGNTSSSDLKASADFDLWKEVDANIKTILVNSARTGRPSQGGSGAAPVVPAPVPMPAPAAPPAPAGDGSPAAAAAAYAAQTAAAASGAAEGPAAAPQPAGSAAPTAAPPPDAGQAQYSINKQTGIVSVFGTGKQQKLVKTYLDKVLEKIGSQVLIEAKVVEISLTDQYNTGVDWQALRQNLKGTGFGLSSLTPSTDTSTAISALPKPYGFSNPFGQYGLNAGFTTFGGDLAAMVNLVKSYGDVRTLSSPRLTVVNNQPATLKVAQNHVYFKLQATVTSTPAIAGSVASQTATYSSTLQTLPIGLVMTVIPTIDAERGVVTMALRPSVTAWPGSTVSDPAVALDIATACGAATNGACSPSNVANAISAASVPVVDIREMESVVSVPSGSVVVLGGLMQEIVSKTDSGVPGAADVPVVGNLFKATNDNTQKTELVIFIKATLVRGPETVDWADKDTYRNYFRDDRPLAF